MRISRLLGALALICAAALMLPVTPAVAQTTLKMNISISQN